MRVSHHQAGSAIAPRMRTPATSAGGTRRRVRCSSANMSLATFGSASFAFSIRRFSSSSARVSCSAAAARPTRRSTSERRPGLSKNARLRENSASESSCGGVVRFFSRNCSSSGGVAMPSTRTFNITAAWRTGSDGTGPPGSATTSPFGMSAMCSRSGRFPLVDETVWINSWMTATASCQTGWTLRARKSASEIILNPQYGRRGASGLAWRSESSTGTGPRPSASGGRSRGARMGPVGAVPLRYARKSTLQSCAARKFRNRL